MDAPSFSRTMTTSMPGKLVFTYGAYAMHGRTFAYSPSVLRTVTFSDLYPPPDGVVIGALRNTFVARSTSQLSGVIPELWPCLYTCSPMSMYLGLRFAPAAVKIFSVASMISGLRKQMGGARRAERRSVTTASWHAHGLHERTATR